MPEYRKKKIRGDIFFGKRRRRRGRMKRAGTGKVTLGFCPITQVSHGKKRRLRKGEKL